MILKLVDSSFESFRFFVISVDFAEVGVESPGAMIASLIVEGPIMKSTVPLCEDAERCRQQATFILSILRHHYLETVRGHTELLRAESA